MPHTRLAHRESIGGPVRHHLAPGTRSRRIMSSGSIARRRLWVTHFGDTAAALAVCARHGGDARAGWSRPVGGRARPQERPRRPLSHDARAGAACRAESQRKCLSRSGFWSIAGGRAGCPQRLTATAKSHYNRAFPRSKTAGGVPERSKGTDCKSVGSAFEGSNPSPSTISRCAGVAQW